MSQVKSSAVVAVIELHDSVRKTAVSYWQCRKPMEGRNESLDHHSTDTKTQTGRHTHRHREHHHHHHFICS